MHAADALNSVHYMLEVLEVQQFLTAKQHVSLIIAAMIHDFMHPGYNQNYLIKSQSRLALTYSDSSVLERMHLAEGGTMVE